MVSFEKQFAGKLKEVFFYITHRCNLACLHCYMGENKNIDNMSIGNFEAILKRLVNLGASKITLLGGEPTLHPLLPRFINVAKLLGIDYLRLDTNGQFDSNLLENPNLRFLNDICFSVDGVDPETHGRIRSEGNYYSVMSNIKKAIDLGYRVRVTMTVNSFNLSQIEKIASKLENMGISVLNLHLTSESGRARKNKWLLVEEEKWMDFYEKILPRLARYSIKVKIPKRYIKEDDSTLNGKLTCEAAKSSRIAVTPNLKIYSCPLFLDRNQYFAYFRNEKFIYAPNYQENILLKEMVKGPGCPLLMKENYKRYRRKKILPICVSYKQTNRDI